jgi:hypothetical protein
MTQVGFLWWLADELRRHVRDESSFSLWLQSQSLDGIINRHEQLWMGQAATALAQAELNVQKLIESFVSQFSQKP